MNSNKSSLDNFMKYIDYIDRTIYV